MEQDLERGFAIASESLKEWASLFEEWILCVERYCRIETEDAPYFYTERANIGVVAGAAWRCGWVALEEFQFEKSDGDAKWPGRLDLWLRSASTTYHAEAKHVWPKLGTLDFSATVAEGLNSACDDATRFVLEEPGPRLGLAFCSPWINAGSEHEIEKLIVRFLFGIEDISHSARAWCFPKATRKLRRDRWLYPGVALLLREVP